MRHDVSCQFVNLINIMIDLIYIQVKFQSLCPHRPASQILNFSSRFVITDHSSTPLELALDVAQLIHVTQYKEMLKTDKNHKFRRKNGKVKVVLRNLFHIFSIKNLALYSHFEFYESNFKRRL